MGVEFVDFFFFFFFIVLFLGFSLFAPTF